MPVPAGRRLRAIAGVALGAVVFVAVVLLAETGLRGLRVDLTEDGLYTVSAETREVLRGIEEPITLTLYFSHDAAEGVPFVRQYAQRVHELLEEYVARSGGRLELRRVDPRPLTRARDDALEFGLEPVPAGGGSDARIFLGLVGTNSTDGLEVIEFLDPARERFLEYDLTRLVWALDRPDKPVVGIMSTLNAMATVDPASGRQRPAWAFVDRLRAVAEVRRVETPTARVDPAIDVLLLVHPRRYGEATLYAIDQYLAHGGRAVVFLDPAAGADSGRSPEGVRRSRSELQPLLDAWGVEVTLEQALADPEHGLVVSRGETWGRTVHPGLIGIDGDGLDRRDVITATLERLAFGSAGAITASGDGLALTPLVRTAPSAALLPAERFAALEDPAALAQGFRPDDRRHVVAARLDGALRSAWPQGPPAGASAPPGGHRAAARDPAHLVLVADSDMLTDALWVREGQSGGRRVRRAWADNGDFVANAVANLAGSDALIRLRGEGTSARPFTRVQTLERRAAARYRDKEQELRAALERTEERLRALRRGEGEAGEGVILSAAQRAALADYRARRDRLRRELREVRQRLDAEIERLGDRLRLLNIVAVPVLVAGAALVVFGLRRRRRSRVRA